MIHIDINGDETTNPDAFLYCAACLATIAHTSCEDFECTTCGANLTSPNGMIADGVITGRALKDKQAAIDRQMAEWIEMNGPHA